MKPIVLLFTALFGLKAHTAMSETVTLVELKQVFTIGEHEWFGMNGVNWVARVERVVDSRCPVNVECFWAGDTQIYLILGLKNTGRPHTAMLNSVSKTSLKYRGILLELLALTPQKGEPGPLKMRFRFRK